MSKARGLGRGFDSLIPAHVEEEFDPAPAEQAIIEIAVETIDPNPHQPRSGFDEQELAALAASIAEHGILQPLVAQPRGDRYQLVAGERRLRAAQQLDMDRVPAIVRSFDEQQSLELALIENIQREQLNPVETAAAYQKLLDQFGLGVADLCRRVGREPSTIKNALRLLKLPTEAKHALAAGDINEGHARAILSVPNEEQQTGLLQAIRDHGWTVRQAEEYARRAKRAGDAAASTQITTETDATRELARQLDTKVQLQHRARGGRLLIHYQDEEDMQRIIQALSSR